MDKNVMKQYLDLKKEISDIENRIAILNGQKDTILKDSVKGSSKFFPYIETNFKLEGIQINSPRKRKIKKYKKQLEDKKDELLDVLIQCEKYIEEIPSIRIRNIIRFRIINGMSWVQVAHKMGGNATEESVRKEYKRFFENN